MENFCKDSLCDYSSFIFLPCLHLKLKGIFTELENGTTDRSPPLIQSADAVFGGVPSGIFNYESNKGRMSKLIDLEKCKMYNCFLFSNSL